MTMLGMMLNSLPTASGLVAFALAFFVMFSNRRAWPNRLLAAGLTALGLHQIALGGTLVAPSETWFFACVRAALGLAALLPPVWLAFGLTLGEPNGGIQLTRWRAPLVSLCVVVPLAWIVLGRGLAVSPIRPAGSASIYVGIDMWGQAFLAILLLGLVLVLLQFENLYRQADRITRWKVKFLVVGVFVAFGTQIIALSYALLYKVLHPRYPALSSLGFLIGELLIAFSLVRHRLLQVDVFVSRYVVYRSFTLALVAGYLIALGAVAEVVHWLDLRLDLVTGLLLGSAGAAGVALVLLSDDVRRRVQGFLHTHFYKHKYDYRIEWMELTHRLAQVTAVPDIAAQTVQRVLAVMWVRQAAMYTATSTSERLALAHQVGYEGLPALLELSSSAVQQLRDAATSLPSAPFPPRPPTALPELAKALCDCPVGILVPVVALDTVAGVLVVGPELSGKPFGVDDRDLLAAMAAQAGAMIVNARLAQEASEGWELQVFARLSAFCAHDLKNSVGMLSLLLENAPRHMHKPTFQADAVQTLKEVTERMRRLLATLNAPRQGNHCEATRVSLAAIVEKWTADLPHQLPGRITLETRFEPTPRVELDPEQLHNVFANLIMNAIEAIPADGHITVETAEVDGWAVLAVTDTGCGMSATFIQDRLFRPFQTTKPCGLGIGLFQCRHIVQACHGTLTAESHDGQGTKMIVRLPAAPVDEFEPFPQPCSFDVAPSPGDKAAPPGSEELDLADLRRKA